MNIRFLIKFLQKPLILMMLVSAPVIGVLPPQDPANRQQARDRDVRQLVLDFVQGIRTGRAAQAYQSYTTPSFRNETRLEEFYTFIARYPSFNRNRSIDILSITYHEDIANVTATLSSQERTSNTVVFAVSYVDGKWHILGIKVYPPIPGVMLD